MSTYTYTLRTKTQNLELADGTVVAANLYGLCGYLCRSNDYDASWLCPGDYGYKRAMGLNATIDKTKERWRGKSAYIITEDPAQGEWVYHAEDAEKAAVWFDCNCPTEAEGVTKVGRLGPRVRKGRKLVWTIMTDEEAEAFDRAEREEHERKKAKYLAQMKARRAQEEVKEILRQKQRVAKDAAQARADAKVAAAKKAADEMVRKAMDEAAKEMERWGHGSR